MLSLEKPLRALVVLCLLEASWAAPASEITAASCVVEAPEPTPEPSVSADGNFVVTVVNSHTAAISTSHFQGAGSPTAIRHDNEGNIVAPDETITFAVPTGWSGRLAMYEEGYDVVDRGSLFEGSFMVDESKNAFMALDVSYVDGFTVPLVCECNQEVVFGCNLDLHNMCPTELQLNAKTCLNPYREDLAPPINNIFEACAEMAYTYPTDDLATKVDIPGCSRSILCCIGTACKPNPSQKLCPGKNGHTQPCGMIGEARKGEFWQNLWSF
ncbi:Osmotin, thaumatin-like protein [Hypoxylon cercidicola]|nr:Osmotin, thaumatin-like protein [Hypoxylon cercidicola]